MAKNTLLGVKIFAWLLIFASIYKLFGLLDYEYYRFMHQQLPENGIPVRYVFSIGLRLVGMVVAIGLLLQKNRYRVIFLSLIIISFISFPAKHAYSIFYNIAIESEYQGKINDYPKGTVINYAGLPEFPEQLNDYKLVYPNNPKISMIIFILIDYGFGIAALIYFTRKKVKQQFK